MSTDSMPSIAHTFGEKALSEPSVTGVSFAVGLYFGFRLFIMILSVAILGTDAQTGVEINLVLNFLLLLIVAFCSLGGADYPVSRMVRLPSVRCALMFLAFSGCSLLWTSAASLGAAIVFWCGMAADIAMVMLLLRVGPLALVAISIMKGFVWGACAVAIIAWLLPAQTDLRLGYQDLLGPNEIGYLCGFAFFFAQYLIREKQANSAVAATLLGLTMFRSLSKTTLLAFFVAEAFLLMRDRSMSRKTKILLVLIALIVLAGFWNLLSSYYDVYTNAGNQAETLSGRLGIWAYFLGESVQQPWFGHGFHSAWNVIPPFGADQFEARHAHNEVLQQFYAYGAIGVCIFIGIYWSFYRQIRRLAAGPSKMFFLALLIFVLVRGLADTEAFDLSLPLWSIVLFSLLIEHARKAATLHSPPGQRESSEFSAASLMAYDLNDVSASIKQNRSRAVPT